MRVGARQTGLQCRASSSLVARRVPSFFTVNALSPSRSPALISQSSESRWKLHVRRRLSSERCLPTASFGSPPRKPGEASSVEDGVPRPPCSLLRLAPSRCAPHLYQQHHGTKQHACYALPRPTRARPRGGRAPSAPAWRGAGQGRLLRCASSTYAAQETELTLSCTARRHLRLVRSRSSPSRTSPTSRRPLFEGGSSCCCCKLTKIPLARLRAAIFTNASRGRSRAVAPSSLTRSRAVPCQRR